MNTTHLLLLAGTIVWSVDAQPFYPATISRPGVPTLSASGNSFMPLLSGDRRYVVFLSSASNLDTNENLAPYLDVYRHDLLTGENVVISRGNADSSAPSVSSDGQAIAFATRASDVGIAPDTNDASDTYLSTGVLISADITGNPPPNIIAPRSLPLSDNPYISADGRWVAFQSFATNLTIEADFNNDSDVFLRDTLSNRTYLISVAVDGVTTANSRCELAAITPDGNYVLLTSTATNLVANAPTNGSREIYLRNAADGITTWIRHDDPQPYTTRWARISADARFVLYKLEFPGTNSAPIALYDRQSDTSAVVTSDSRPAYPIHMSSDGRFIAYDENDQIFLWDRQADTRSPVSDSGTDIVSHSPVVSENGSIVAFVNSSNDAPFQIWYKNMVTGQVRRLTENSAGDPSSKDHDGSTIVVDPQGEFIVFDSAEDQLVANDHNHASDVFVHTIATGVTRLISRAHDSLPSYTPIGAAGITNNCISADGNRILFFSGDSTLVPGDTNGWYDAFLHDRRTGQTVSLTADGNGAFSPVLSTQHGLLTSDGHFALLGIVTRSNRFDLAGSSGTIIRRDLDSGETLIVASNLTSNPSQSFSSRRDPFAFVISDDGQRVAYPKENRIVVVDLSSGTETNLYPFGWARPLLSADGRYLAYNEGPTFDGLGANLVVIDLSNGQRRLITNRYYYTLGGAVLSQDGRSVAYGTTTNGPRISLYSISSNSNAPVCSLCSSPAVSADGSFVAYRKGTYNSYQLELKDMRTGKTTFLTQSITDNVGADAEPGPPVVSADGRFVAYTTRATNLTTDPPNGWNNLYVYDRLQGTTLRVTGARGNTGYGSGSASRPVIGPDGRTLVFQSFASDFVSNDFNDTRDIFLLRLGEGDADNDGMSDSWEQTYFGTSDRDGTGDFDNDGQSDLAEYLAGTDPTNNQSVLEVLTITSVSTGQRQLIWRAEPGKSYRVEYKSDLQGATWTSLGQVITASSSTASAIDTNVTPEKRFYRVALVQ